MASGLRRTPAYGECAGRLQLCVLPAAYLLINAARTAKAAVLRNRKQVVNSGRRKPLWQAAFHPGQGHVPRVRCGEREWLAAEQRQTGPFPGSMSKASTVPRGSPSCTSTSLAT